MVRGLSCSLSVRLHGPRTLGLLSMQRIFSSGCSLGETGSDHPGSEQVKCLRCQRSDFSGQTFLKLTRWVCCRNLSTSTSHQKGGEGGLATLRYFLFRRVLGVSQESNRLLVHC